MAIDFDKVCRSCLTEANRMHFIFQAEEDETFSISQLLNSITDIQVSAVLSVVGSLYFPFIRLPFYNWKYLFTSFCSLGQPRRWLTKTNV